MREKLNRRRQGDAALFVMLMCSLISSAMCQHLIFDTLQHVSLCAAVRVTRAQPPSRLGLGAARGQERYPVIIGIKR